MKYTSVAVSLAVAATTAFAAANTMQSEPTLEFIDNTIDGEPLRFDASRLDNLLAQAKQGKDTPTPLAPAPPLTYLQVYAVGSSNVGWEYPPSSNFSTTYDHGGSTLLAVVFEEGYGGTPIGKMNGSQLPSSANYRNDAVCENMYGEYVTPCSSGQTVVGWLRYWNLSGNQSGTFYEQNTSLNSPGNTMSDQIYIR